MSYAQQSLAALVAAAEKAYAPTLDAGRAFAAAHKVAKICADQVDAMRAVGAMVLAAEALQEAAEQATKALRAKLTEQMLDSGCTSFTTEHQTFSLSRKPSFVSFDDERLIPEDYKVQPPPTWDRKAISAALKAGELVPGCNLVKPNDMNLVIRGRKQEAA